MLGLGMCTVVNWEGKFYVIDRVVCGFSGIKWIIIVNIIINMLYSFIILFYNNNKNVSN